jgi:hypothetical protein
MGNGVGKIRRVTACEQSSKDQDATWAKNIVPCVPGIEEFYQLLRKAWSKGTSQDSIWTPARVSLGQCVATSLVVQDTFGGDILTANFGGTWHNWNRLSSGEEVDLTRDQFAFGVKKCSKTRVMSRDAALESLGGKRKEYQKLRARLDRLASDIYVN